MNKSSSNLKRNGYEPVFVNARREALIVLTVWIIGLAWTVGYCLLAGYDVPAGQMKTTFGMPSWVFWGILVPWVLVILFTMWFGLFCIADDELVAGQDESDGGHYHNRPQPETDEVSR